MVKNDPRSQAKTTAHRKVWTHESEQQAVPLARKLGNTDQGIAIDLGISQSALSSRIKAVKSTALWNSALTLQEFHSVVLVEDSPCMMGLSPSRHPSRIVS